MKGSTAVICLLALPSLGIAQLPVVRRLGKPSDDDDAVEASSCFSCFSPSWGWSMGPFSDSSARSYQFDLFRSNTNGCTRPDGDPDTLTGTVIVEVSDADNNGILEFKVTAETIDSYFFRETQVFIGTSEPGTKRPSPGQDSSKCYASGSSDSTCLSASGTTQIHEILDGTADGEDITTSSDWYFWIHAAETTTGDTVYARSDLGVQCSDVQVATPSSPDTAATTSPISAPTKSPVPSPTSAPVPAPTMSPVPSPTSSPVPAPTKSPLPAPTKSPVPSPTSAPILAPPTQNNGGGACFHGSGTVLLESGSTLPLSELQIGERIKTSDGEGKFSFSPITALPHAKNDEPAAFLTLTTETGKSVSMTSDHFIPKCDLVSVMAGELVVGDCVVTVDGKETLVDIMHTSKYGVYTAITKNEFIVVDGIVASPFSKDSDPAYPERDYVKYRQQLEAERLRQLSYRNRKAAASMAKSILGNTHLRGHM